MKNKWTLFLWILALSAPAFRTAFADELQGSVVDRQGRPVEHALVYVAPSDIASVPPEQPVVLDQKDYQFRPRVLPVVAGTTVEFRNNDPDVHNVHAHSTIAHFNFTLPSPGATHRIRFSTPGVVKLLCNVHSQMGAYIVVLKTPYFAVTDAAGTFRMANPPTGRLSMSLWYEGKVVKTVDVSGGEPIRISLEEMIQAEKPGTSGPPIRSWEDVVRGVETTLKQAMDRALAGDAEGAKKAQDDAYYVYFEAKGMEVAINQNISSRRKAELEDMFWEIRKGVVELSARQKERGVIEALMSGLVQELRKDAAELTRQGVRDSSWDAVVPAKPQKTAPSRDRYAQVVKNIEGLLDQAALAFRQGDRRQAEALVKRAYFDEFHQIEMSLKAHDRGGTLDLERRFSDLLIGNVTDRELQRRIQELMAGVRAVAGRVTERGGTPWVVFTTSLGIILREGFEAILILGAIVALLVKLGSRHLLKVVYGGAAAALAASLVTAVVVHTALSRTASEVVEGITLLAAAAVLVYVSYWFVSKAQAAQWQKFVMGKVQGAMGKGGAWTLGIISFLAVYREGAETVLFYQALRADAPGMGMTVLLGFAAGCAGLAVLYLVFRYATVKMPLKPFFIVTSIMLFVMAFFFAGQGVAELQEGGVLPPSKVLAWLVQGAFVLAGAIAVLYFMTRKNREVKSPEPLVKEVANEA